MQPFNCLAGLKAAHFRRLFRQELREFRSAFHRIRLIENQDDAKREQKSKWRGQRQIRFELAIHPVSRRLEERHSAQNIYDGPRKYTREPIRRGGTLNEAAEGEGNR